MSEEQAVVSAVQDTGADTSISDPIADSVLDDVLSEREQPKQPTQQPPVPSVEEHPPASETGTDAEPSELEKTKAELASLKEMMSPFLNLQLAGVPSIQPQPAQPQVQPQAQPPGQPQPASQPIQPLSFAIPEEVASEFLNGNAKPFTETIGNMFNAVNQRAEARATERENLQIEKIAAVVSRLIDRKSATTDFRSGNKDIANNPDAINLFGKWVDAYQEAYPGMSLDAVARFAAIKTRETFRPEGTLPVNPDSPLKPAQATFAPKPKAGQLASKIPSKEQKKIQKRLDVINDLATGDLI